MRTWYQNLKATKLAGLEKEAGWKQNLLVAAITSLLMLPIDLVALHFSKKMNTTPEQIKQSLTSEIFNEAKDLLNNPNDPVAESLIRSAEQEITEAKSETKTPEVDLSKWEADIDVVARTLYGEAANQGEAGLKAVASVIWNRAGGDKSRFKTKCLQRKQFSCWNDGVVTVNKLSGKWAICKDIAKSMFLGTFQPTIDANHYYAFQGKHKISVPYWGVGQTPVGTVGDHRFYKL